MIMLMLYAVTWRVHVTAMAAGVSGIGSGLQNGHVAHVHALQDQPIACQQLIRRLLAIPDRSFDT